MPFTEALEQVRKGKYIAANKGKPAVQAVGGTSPLQDNLDSLMRGKIDAFIEDPSVFAYYCATKKVYSVIKMIVGDNDRINIGI